MTNHVFRILDFAFFLQNSKNARSPVFRNRGTVIWIRGTVSLNRNRFFLNRCPFNIQWLWDLRRSISRERNSINKLLCIVYRRLIVRFEPVLERPRWDEDHNRVSTFFLLFWKLKEWNIQRLSYFSIFYKNKMINVDLHFTYSRIWHYSTKNWLMVSLEYKLIIHSVYLQSPQSTFSFGSMSSYF